MKSRSSVLFYLIPAYILLQLGWWAWLLSDLNKSYFDLQLETGMISTEEAVSLFRKKMLMILGEGAVFLFFLFLGIRYAHKRYVKEMENISRQKNFMLAIAHEFKSPLASQKLQLETILSRDLDQDRVRKLISNSLSDSNRLQHLTENILTAYKLAGDEYPLFPEEFNLKDECAELISGLPEAHEKKALIRNEMPSIEVKLDRQAFDSIIVNLTENALKYAAGGEIVIYGKVDAGKLKIVVSDQGPGIPPEYRKKVFEKFFRLGREENRKAKGTGLGLFIVQNLVGRQRGSVVIKSNSPKGAIFEVSIPLNE